MSPGAVCADAPVTAGGQQGWLLLCLGNGFTILAFGRAETVDWNGKAAQALNYGQDQHDSQGLVTTRYDGLPGICYLIRPNPHVAARSRSFNPAKVRRSIARTCSAERDRK